MYDYLSRQIFERNIRRNYLYYKNSFLITRLIFSNLSMLFYNYIPIVRRPIASGMLLSDTDKPLCLSESFASSD